MDSTEEKEGSPGQASKYGKDWTKGSIVRNLLSLSWPIIVGNSVWVVGWTVDMIWVGKLGAPAVAGVGVAGIIVMMVLSAEMGLITGVRAMVARFIGAGDDKNANITTGQAFIISAIESLVMAVAGILFAEQILTLLGMEADAIAEGAPYLRIIFAGWVTMSVWMMAEGIMQASGDTRTPMRAAIYAMVAQLILCPLLVNGWWIFPRLGVSGAALSNVISQSMGMIFLFSVLIPGRSRLHLTLSALRLNLNIIWRIVRISIPAAVMGIQRSFGGLVLMWFIVPYGTLAIAAHTLSQRLEMFLFIAGISLGMGAGVLVGQNLGAGHPERAARIGWITVGLVEGFMVICAAVTLLWTESIVHIFNTEPALVEITIDFLRIAAIGFLVTGITFVLQSCISGAGDTLPPMLVSIVTVWLLQLPLVYFLPRVTDLGVNGVRWAMVISVFVGAVTYTIYFSLGRWKRKKV